MTIGTSLLIVTGTRADFGLWLPVMRSARDAGLAVRLLVTAMHLDPRFGNTLDEVRLSGFEVAASVPCTAVGDSLADMSRALARALDGMTPAIESAAPDRLLVLGDRGEQLAAALAALHLGVSVVHLHGGERTRGAIDDVLRDLISRIANLHLTATSEAAETLERMGIARDRIEVTGAPGLDAIAARDDAGDPELRHRYGIADGPYLVLAYHPETTGRVTPSTDAAEVLAAIRDVGLPTLVVLPNADAGGRGIAAGIREAGDMFVGVHASLPRDAYLGLLTGAAALVGNSSSGIIEAPFLRVPAVNVGRRQDGRTRGDNVIDVPADSPAISAAIRQAVNPTFRAALTGRSPYGDGHAAPRIIARIIAEAG